MKVGITCNCKNDTLFANGIDYNILLWYKFLELCGYIPYLIYGSINNEIKEKYGELFDKKYRIVEYNPTEITDINKSYIFKEIEVIFFCGFYDINLLNISKEKNKKNIYIMMGNEYQYDVQSIIENNNNIILNYNYDEIWISPHFEYSKDYLEIRYKTKVVVCPYIWEPLLMEKYGLKDNVKSIENTIDVAIMEPNLNYGKTCLIPISICELNEKDINNVYVFSAHHLKENKFIHDVIMKKEIIRKGKTSFEHRVKITDIVSKYCNVVVSCNENWDLNYVFLECFYLGVPLVHNSEFLKEYGYYYPDLRINKTLGMFEDIKNNFNKTDYIEKHKEVLFKYSIHNLMNQKWVKEQIKVILS